MSDDWEHAAENSAKCYEVGIAALRERLEASRVVIKDCVLYCEEAEFVVPTLLPVDALVTDPPYGIGEANGKNASRSKAFGAGGPKNTRGRKIFAQDYGEDSWDNQLVSPELIAAIRKNAHWQIIFGGNYYDLPPTSCWLVWDKLNSGDFADCELAWTNLPKAVRRLQYMWNGMLRRERHIPREHPTQKPVGVMKWCIEQLPSGVETILDPFMGSGSTLVAAVQLGKKGIGIERERKYFDIACRRIEEAYQQGDLFVAPPENKPEQMTLLESAPVKGG